MATGSIKWFNDARGFGFPMPDGGEDIFIHVSAIQSQRLKTLPEGQRANFDITVAPHGKQSRNIQSA